MSLLSDLLSMNVKWVAWGWLLIEFFYCKSSICKGRTRLRWRWWVQNPVCLKHLNCQPQGWSLLRAPDRRKKGFKQQPLAIVKKINKNRWPHFPVLSAYVSCEFNCVKKASETACGQGPPAASVCPGWGSRRGAASSPDLASFLPKLRCCQVLQTLRLRAHVRRWCCQQLHRNFVALSIMERNKAVYVCGHVLEWPSGADWSSFHGQRLWLPSHPCANLALLPGASAWPWHMDHMACPWAAWGLPYSCPFPCLLWSAMLNIGFCKNRLENALWLWLLLVWGVVKGLKVGAWLFLESSQLLCSWSQIPEQWQMPNF